MLRSSPELRKGCRGSTPPRFATFYRWMTRASAFWLISLERSMSQKTRQQAKNRRAWFLTLGQYTGVFRYDHGKISRIHPRKESDIPEISVINAMMCSHHDHGGISCFGFIVVLDAPRTQVVSNLTYSHCGKGNTIRFRPKVCVLAPGRRCLYR